MASLTWRQLLLLVAGLAVIALPCQATLGLNTIQVLHAHNSYHICPSKPVKELLLGNAVANPLMAAYGNTVLDPFDYSMPPLSQLLVQRGVRSIEIDVNYDPSGGRYRYRAGAALAKIVGLTNDTSEIKGPSDLGFPAGWKVAHVIQTDYKSTCYSLKSCLRIVKAWTSEYKRHFPLFVRIEAKYVNYNDLVNASTISAINELLVSGINTTGGPSSLLSAPPATMGHLKLLEREILSVLKRSQIYTPDDFRGRYATQRMRINKAGWPSIDRLAGKVIFVLIGANTYSKLYETLYPSSKGALMFVENYPSEEVMAGNSTVFVQISSVLDGGGTVARNESLAKRIAGYKALCTKLVKAGFLLRAPADTQTIQAREMDYTASDAALSCGVHFISTDYPNGLKSMCAFKSNYTLNLGGSGPRLASTCNPITRTKQCIPKQGKFLPRSCSCWRLALSPRLNTDNDDK